MGGMSEDRADAVPVPVLEVLASAWEDQAERADRDGEAAASVGEIAHRDAAVADTLAECARMLREAIAQGGRE